MPRLPVPRLPPGGSLGTPKILGTGATLHLVPLCLHVNNWGCRALKSSARYQKFGVPCPIFSACKWGLNDNIIRTPDSLKILGVTIVNKLNFNEHINDVCNEASQRVGVIMRLRNLIPTTAKLVLLKSAVLEYLTY